MLSLADLRTTEQPAEDRDNDQALGAGNWQTGGSSPHRKNLLRIRSEMFRTAYIGPLDRHWIRSHCGDFCGYTASKPCQIAGNRTKYPATLSTGKWLGLSEIESF
jgi:hypothetical protein